MNTLVRLREEPAYRLARMSAEPHFTLEHVSKVFRSKGSEVVALTDINLQLFRNEFICLVGPSGCGKSTLLKMLAGLSAPSGGAVTRHGRIDGDNQGVGMVFQTPVLLPWKKVLANVVFPSVVQGAAGSKATERAQRLLSLVGLSEFAMSYPHQLSGGMQQRVAICRALMCEGDVLLMDEPFGALDALTRDELAMELKNICSIEKRTVVFVTHSISEAVYLADRIVVMSPRPGRISDIVDVNIERAGDITVSETREFQSLVSHVRRSIGHGKPHAAHKSHVSG